MAGKDGQGEDRKLTQCEDRKLSRTPRPTKTFPLSLVNSLAMAWVWGWNWVRGWQDALRCSRNSEEGLGLPQSMALGDSRQFNSDHKSYKNPSPHLSYTGLSLYNFVRFSVLSSPSVEWLIAVWLPAFTSLLRDSKDCPALLFSPVWRSDGSGLGQGPPWDWQRQWVGLHKAAKCATGWTVH